MLKHKRYYTKRGEGPLNMEFFGRLLVLIALAAVSALMIKGVVKGFSGSDTAITVDAQKIRDAIQIGLSTTTERCIVTYGELKLDDPVQLVQKGDMIKFFKQSGEERKILDVEPVEARLCVVSGIDETDNFYLNVKEGKSLSPEYVEEDKFRIQVEDYKDSREWAYDLITTSSDGEEVDQSIRKTYLYKADGNHICFLSILIDTGRICNRWENRGNIDNDCIRDWTDGDPGNKEIPLC
jgi:hypothetical protein